MKGCDFTNWQAIYKHLENKGYKVYSLGQHSGQCDSPYIVLRNEGSAPRKGVELPTYELLLYYPFNQYSEFEGYIESVKECMNDLYPSVWLMDGPGPHYLDPDVNGYMTNLVYQGLRKSKINRLGKE